MGKIATDLMKTDGSVINPQEIQRAQEKEYLDNLIWCVRHAKKQVPCDDIKGHEECTTRDSMDGDFYVVGILKKEKLLENVIRNYWVPTITCPTPTYDQTLYKYDHRKDDIQFMWVIPDRETCLTLFENKDIVVPQERSLLQFIIDFYDGTLLQKAKRFNGESIYAGNLLQSTLDKI